MHKILIVAPAWVGDLVMAQSMFKLIKQRNIDAIIHVLALWSFSSLLERMPEVDKIITTNLMHGKLELSKRFKIAKGLVPEHYSEAIILPNSFKSVLIPYFAKIPVRRGWRGEMRYKLLNDMRILDKKEYPLMVNRFLALGFPKKEIVKDLKLWPVLTPTPDQINKTLECLQKDFASSNYNCYLELAKIGHKNKILAFCPGAEYGSSKRWPAEYFAKVAISKVAEGWSVWLFGAYKDKVITDEIQKLSGNVCLNLAGKTNLGQVVDLLSLTSAVVTNDSGLMHVAAALDLPIVAIYGSSSPNFTPPLANRKKILSLNLPCSPCFKRECPLGHNKCMRDLTPKLVLDTLASVLNDEKNLNS